MTIDHSDCVGFPAEPTRVHRKPAKLELSQERKGARALQRFKRAQKARDEAKPEHPYFASCVCERCKSTRERMVAA